MEYEIDFSNDNDNEYHSKAFTILIDEPIADNPEDIEIDSIIENFDIDEVDLMDELEDFDDEIDEDDIDDEYEEDDYNIEDDEEEDDDILIEEETIALEMSSYNQLLNELVDDLQYELDEI